MKKFFTRYLPVEGEIKDGQTGISINNAVYTHYDHLGSDYGKPAKLFLCSRDIQVGDEVITPYPTNTKNVVNENNLELFKSNAAIPFDKVSMSGTWLGSFKIIGEVSPEATWVKEDMEFDREGLQFWEPVDSIGIMGVVENITITELAIIKIKGSCGHFH